MKLIAKILTASLLWVTMSVMALELDSAKAQGLVGEQPDGYLGVVSASAEVKALVADINAKRKARYAELAAENNISIEQVEALAGKKAYSKTASGHYLLVNGEWVKK